MSSKRRRNKRLAMRAAARRREVERRADNTGNEERQAGEVPGAGARMDERREDPREGESGAGGSGPEEKPSVPFGAGDAGDRRCELDDLGEDEREFVGHDRAAVERFKMILRQCVDEFILEPASGITPLPVEWLWPGRIPRGHLALLAGDPDAGKSLVTIDMAARVSTGAPWPDQPDQAREPGNALILTTHDNPA